MITGVVRCDEGTPVDIIHEFEILGNIPIETQFSGSIPIVESSTIEIPLEANGNQSQMWLVGTDGPLSRIATTENNQKLSDGSMITLNINPEGLLSAGMLVKGEIILASDSGHRYYITVELVAGEEDESVLEEWTSPAKLIPIALALATLWVILGIKSAAGKVSPEEQEVPVVPLESDNPSLVDPFS